MKLVRELAVLSEVVGRFRTVGETIAFVPTMGALHEGHLSLVRIGRSRAHRVVVSIFVNPTQFGPEEDYLRYPRPETRDLELLDEAGVDVVYMPSVASMYHPRASVTVDPGPVGQTFEGRIRPHHFRGVLTIVSKLFNQVQPDIAVFGQKDAQQLFLVRAMARDLNFPVEIIGAETAREADGLALSSRNVYLKKSERPLAAFLYRALLAGKTAIESGVTSLGQIKPVMFDVLAGTPDVVADYLTVVSEESFTEVDPISSPSRLIGAIRLGSVRLIDNLPVHAA